jgi:small-conductance mechanosensitive channel
MTSKPILSSKRPLLPPNPYVIAAIEKARTFTIYALGAVAALSLLGIILLAFAACATG